MPTEGSEAVTEGTMEMIEPPEFALGWTVDVTSDADGAVVTANEIELNVVPSGFELSCDWAGKPVNEEFGHYHVLLDHALVDMSCAETFVLSMQNVAPGVHTVAVARRSTTMSRCWRTRSTSSSPTSRATRCPSSPTEAFDGEPTIRIVSPADGDTVSGTFDVVVEVENYNLNCDLYGKPAVFGYGHYHVNADTMEGPMMGMITMFGMACTNTFQASTEGLEAGSTHSIIALLSDNGHAPLMNPEAADFIEVTIGE